MSNKSGNGSGLVVERQAAQTAEPQLFQVILLNDDYTPMEFVVEVLQKFFGKSTDEAVAIMLQVHQKGRGVCGIYIQDIAATRVSQVTQHARDWQHPLQCLMEPVGN